MNTILINHKKGLRPEIKLTVTRVEPNIWYDLGFYKYHYLSESLNKAAKCFLISWDGDAVAFVALLNSPRKGMPNGMSVSRIVVLPDYQGLGFSTQILNFFGGILKSISDEHFLYLKTIHKMMGEALEKSETWIPTPYNRKIRTFESLDNGKYRNRFTRLSFCLKYSGKKIYGYDELLEPIGILRDKKSQL